MLFLFALLVLAVHSERVATLREYKSCVSKNYNTLNPDENSRCAKLVGDLTLQILAD